MSVRQAIASALHLFVVFFFFTTGLFFVLLSYLPRTRVVMIDFLSNRYVECTEIGMGFFLIALIFLIGFYAFNRGKYLTVRMGISADLKLVHHAIEDCFSKKFPKKISLKEIELGPKGLLSFTVHLAPLDESAREDLFIKVEEQLGCLLQERFGYTQTFYLMVKT